MSELPWSLCATATGDAAAESGCSATVDFVKLRNKTKSETSSARRRLPEKPPHGGDRGTPCVEIEMEAWSLDAHLGRIGLLEELRERHPHLLRGEVEHVEPLPHERHEFGIESVHRLGHDRPEREGRAPERLERALVACVGPPYRLGVLAGTDARVLLDRCHRHEAVDAVVVPVVAAA